MASVMRSTSPKKEPVEATQQESSTGNTGGNVQSYLISKYREALKKGDKSAAKSCLLAARYFSVNDPNVTNEIYIMAKSDGDVSEASKCFANIFNDLFLSSQQNPDIDATPELLNVVNQVKEETRILLGELKSHFIKLKSMPAPASLMSRHTAPSVQPSPMLSPRLRLSSEDRIAVRESVSKLDSHLHSSTKSFFYQQMFDNMPENVKKSILDHSIENCDNSFERCRLMMLAMTIFNERVNTYGSRLLRTLMELSTSPEKPDSPTKNTTNVTKCHYAKSLLILDAIPLILNLTSLSSLDINFNDLLEQTLIFYSEHCLEKFAQEHEASELHEGVKKAIATRILGTEMNSMSEECVNEINLIATLNLISKKYLETVSDDSIRSKLQEFADLMVADKSNMTSLRYEQLVGKIQSMNLEGEIPEQVLFSIKREPSVAPTPPVVTPPPKARGRPKKQQTPPSQPVQQSVAVEDVALQNKTREIQFAFFFIVQHIFINCASYLRRTRSRVMLNFTNPLADQIETDILKSTSQRTSRSKTGSQQSQQNESSSANDRQALKKIKLSKTVVAYSTSDESPLNSEQSKMMDSSILGALIEAQKSLEFLNSNYGSFTKLWQRFLNSNNTTKLKWFKRITIDSMLISKQFDELSALLEPNIGNENDDDCDIKMEQSGNGLSTLTILPTSPPSVAKLRNLVQLICCYVQLSKRLEAYSSIDVLITKMKQCGLMNNDDKNPTSENLIEEYRICFDDKDHKQTGFLFFDCWSMTRYCVDLLKEIMGTYAGFYSAQVHNVPDLAIGHAIVLSQFDWPKDFLLYDHCVTWIRRNKPTSTTPQCLSAATKFTYPEFFTHIRNPHILEDFMALLIRGYTLDIKGSSGANSFMGSSTSQSRTRDNSLNSSQGSTRSTSSGQTSKSGKAITTRGVNKTFKEDLKVSLVTQMRNLSVSVSLDMISDFIQATLLPYLNALKK